MTDAVPVAVGSRVEFVVGSADDGKRLDLALAAVPEVASRAGAVRLLDAGAVTVDGRPRPKSHRLAAGETVVAEIAPAAPRHDPEPDVEARLSIAYEDEHLIVVDKPPGLVVHPSAGHATGTLVQLLAGRAAGGGEPWRPGIVQRLDRDTSGLMVVAKSDVVHEALAALIRRRALQREYLALVEGRPDALRGTIDAPIGRDRVSRTLQSTRTDRPREARTHFEIEQAYPATTLLRVRLETGRTHQIRVHLAAIGHPVCGDPQYGGSASGRRLDLTRQFLHSARLRFDHPVGGAAVDCESALPADLEAASRKAAQESAAAGADAG